MKYFKTKIVTKIFFSLIFGISSLLINDISIGQYKLIKYDLFCGAGPSNDLGRSIIKTIEGGFAIAGTSGSCGLGMSDWLFIKLDMDENHISKLIGSTKNDSCNSLIQLAHDSGFILAGLTKSTGTTQNATFIKLDKSGKYKYARIISGLPSPTYYISEYKQVITRSDFQSGEVLAFTGWKIIYEPVAHLVKRILFTQYKDNGSFQFGFIYTGEVYSESVAYSLCFNNIEKKYCIAAKTNYFSGSLNVWDIMLLNLSLDGNIIWKKVYKINKGFYPSSEPRKIISLQDGGFAVIGFTNANNKTKNDIIVFRVDRKGKIIWSKIYGDADLTEIGYSITNNDNALILTGTSENGSLIMKIKADNGEILNIERYKSHSSICTDIISYEKGYAITGFFKSPNQDAMFWKLNNNLKTGSSSCNDSISIISSNCSMSLDSFNITRMPIQSGNVTLKSAPAQLENSTICSE